MDTGEFDYTASLERRCRMMEADLRRAVEDRAILLRAATDAVAARLAGDDDEEMEALHQAVLQASL